MVVLIAAPVGFLSAAPSAWRLYDSVVSGWAGVGLAAVGLLGFVWAMASLGGAYSPCYDSSVPDAVVKTGPYRFVRHPIYLCNGLQLGGVAVAVGSPWLYAAAAVVACYYITSARQEERLLSAELPGYSAYRDRTAAAVPWPVGRQDRS